MNDRVCLCTCCVERGTHIIKAFYTAVFFSELNNFLWITRPNFFFWWLRALWIVMFRVYFLDDLLEGTKEANRDNHICNRSNNEPGHIQVMLFLIKTENNNTTCPSRNFQKSTVNHRRSQYFSWVGQAVLIEMNCKYEEKERCKQDYRLKPEEDVGIRHDKHQNYV